jgi:lysozyme
MDIIIKESQLNRLIEQVKIDKVEKLADDVYNATSGVGTDEQKVYNTLRQINNVRLFVQFNTKLISKYKESFYEIVNATMEFTESEKNEIVSILNQNGIPHIINSEGDVQYNKPKINKPNTNLQSVNNLSPSEELINFLKCEEGKVGSKCQPVLQSYRIPGDVWTIGWGHTGEYAKPKSKINPTQAEKILRRDTNTASECVKRIFSEWQNKNINRPITQSMFDSLTSLAFNAGCGSLRGTSSKGELIDYVKEGNFAEAANLITNFNANKPGFSGLKKRREKEKQMFCKEGGCQKS